MPYERQRNDERNEVVAIVFYGFEKLGAFRRTEKLAKVPDHVLQGVHVPTRGRRSRQSGHECLYVRVANVVARLAFRIGDDAPERLLA